VGEGSIIRPGQCDELTLPVCQIDIAFVSHLIAIKFRAPPSRRI
jgi:hypothetical protein